MTGIGVLVVAGGAVYNMSARSSDGGNAGQIGLGGDSGSIGNNGNAGNGGNIIISSTSGVIGLSPLIAAGGDINGTFQPQTGNGGDGGTLAGSGGDSGSIGNNGDGGNGGLIKVTSQSGDQMGVGTVMQGAKAICFVAAGGVVALIVLFPPGSVIFVRCILRTAQQARTGYWYARRSETWRR